MKNSFYLAFQYIWYHKIRTLILVASVTIIVFIPNGLEKLITEKKCNKGQVCCVGDDLPDIPMFRHAGLRVAVSDAAPEVKEAADWVTRFNGGEGAVREVCELILKSQGKWPRFDPKEK